MSQSMFTFLVFAAMIIGFFVAYFWGRKRGVPIGLYILFGAIVGSLVAGEGFTIRHYIEGSFLFLDIVFIIITASIFVSILTETGAMNIIIEDMVRVFHNNTYILLILLVFVVMIPGAFAGSGTAAVMAVGGAVGSTLLKLGLPQKTVTALVALAGMYGLAAPPINVPAMVIASGINMPYDGFFLPLIVLTVPLAIFTALFMGAKHVDRSIDPGPIVDDMETPDLILGRFGAYLPFIIVIGLFIFENLLPELLPVLGTQLVFIIGAIIAMIVVGDYNFVKYTNIAIRRTYGVSVILIAVGSFVQIMTLTGVRGFLVVSGITAPAAVVLLALVILLPLSGSFLGAFGSAAAFAVPFMLAVMGPAPIIEATGIAFICSLATLCPPSAIIGNASRIVTGYEGGWVPILKRYTVPAIIMCVLGVLFIVYSMEIGAFL